MSHTKAGLFLIGICLICGIVMLFFGIRGCLSDYALTQNYDQTEGYFTDYSVYASDEDGTTYRLIYTYIVYGKRYTVATDYGTQIIPAQNSTRTVKYDPFQPQNAVLAGGGSNAPLLFLGVMFTFVPLVFVFAILYNKGYMQNLLKNVLDFGIGIFFIIMGLGSLFFVTGSINLLKILKSFHPVLLIPLLMVAAGALQFGKTLAAKLRARKTSRLE